MIVSDNTDTHAIASSSSIAHHPNSDDTQRAHRPPSSFRRLLVAILLAVLTVMALPHSCCWELAHSFRATPFPRTTHNARSGPRSRKTIGSSDRNARLPTSQRWPTRSGRRTQPANPCPEPSSTAPTRPCRRSPSSRPYPDRSSIRLTAVMPAATLRLTLRYAATDAVITNPSCHGLRAARLTRAHDRGLGRRQRSKVPWQ